MARMVAISLTRPCCHSQSRSAPSAGLVRTRQRHVAAEQRLALALEARAQRIGQRADAGDDRHAQRHAGDEDVEALEAVALLAQRQAERSAAGRATHGRALDVGDARRVMPVASSAPAIAPVRHAHDAAAALAPAARSCVTSTRVACRRRCRPNSRSTTCSPVLPSRLPVGSSARMICGRGLSARASATRCCSPPESWAGK